jgi:intracellular sulfur oxidation DsrE/DsrF family protein
VRSGVNDDVSFERLNAFVDGELDHREAGRVLEAIRRDPVLAQLACELRLGKDLIRHAYPLEAETGRGRRERSRGGWRRLGAAAIVLVAIGAVAGWTGHEWQQSDGEDYSSLARRAGAVAQVGATDRILLHASSSAPDRVAALLDEVEGMLAAARRAGRPIAIEVLANGTGLDMLRAGASGPASRLASLRTEYPNLTLVACGQTIARLREKGVVVQLLPGTEVTTSALDEVVKRIHEGWTYVRV